MAMPAGDPPREDTLEIPRTNVRWPGRQRPVTLERAHRRLIRRRLGVDVDVRPPSDTVRVAETRLPADARAALSAVVGERHVLTDAAARLGRGGGMSYLDLLHRRTDTALDLPDAVVRPADHEQVTDVLRVVEEHRLALVPYGGGTSVVGGVTGTRNEPTVLLDLGRLDELVELDEESQTATLQPGLTGPAAERLLAEYGYTLAHFPQSWEVSTVGGWVATRSAGQLSSGVGSMHHLVTALRVATPRGTLRLGRGPGSAAGPDLRELFIGSEGAFGVVTEVTVRVRPTPKERVYLGWSFPDLASGLAACRTLAQEGVAPDLLRLSDPTETTVNLDLAGRAGRAVRTYQRMRGQRSPCLAITGWEGHLPAVVKARRRLAEQLLRDAGAMPLGPKVGESWRHGRYGAPYLRDALLDVSLLVETLETAASWATLPELHARLSAAVDEALRGFGTTPVVFAHVSHVYPTGASLYVTVLADRADRPDEQWWAAKRAAMEVITELGATITHHHAVGTDHAPWLVDEIGPLGVQVLRAVKRELDPAGILNPGVLVPPTR